MNFETLRYVIELGRYRSFSQAADSVFISRQGFGKAIKALEDELGVALATRSHEGVSLTAQGAIVLSAAQDIMDIYRRMLLDLRLATDGQGHSKLHITSTPYIMQVSAEAQIFLDTLSVANLDELPFASILDALKAGSPSVYACELFGSSHDEIDSKTIRFEPFSHAVAGVIWSGECPFRNPDSVSLAELRSAPLAVSSIKSLSYFSKLIFGSEEPEDVRYRTSSFRSLIEAVKTQNLVALFDSYAFNVMSVLDSHELGVGFSPIASPNASFDIGFIYRKDTVLAPEYRQYINRAKLFP